MLSFPLAPARAARLLVAAVRNLGDAPGHEFHGNQWTEAANSALDSLEIKHGDEIPTSAIFSDVHSYNDMPLPVVDVKATGEMRDIPVKSLVAGQSSVSTLGVHRYINGGGHQQGKTAQVVESLFGGKYHIVEGHHRLAADILGGKKTVRVEVLPKSRTLAAASANRDSTPLHRAADAHLQIMTLALRAAFNVARKALKGSLRAAGDIEGHEFHGNQYTLPAGVRDTPENRGIKWEKQGAHFVNAEPVTLYHGTTESRAAKIESEGLKFGNLTPKPEYAAEMARIRREGEKPVVFKVEAPRGSVHPVFGGPKGIRTDALALAKPITSVSRHTMKTLASALNISSCISTLHAALLERLPPVLIKTWVAGASTVGKTLRAAGDVTGHEFHGNQWTAGSGEVGSASSKMHSSIGQIDHDGSIQARYFNGPGERLPNGGRLTEADKVEHKDSFARMAAPSQRFRVQKVDELPGMRVQWLSEPIASDYFSVADHYEREGVKIVGQFVSSTGLKMLDPRKLRDAEAFRALRPQVKGEPHSTSGAFNLAFNVDDPRAIAWAEQHAAELAQGISDSARERIQNAIAGRLEGEDTFDDILDAVGDDARAEMIARTEVMTAANEGQREGWDAAVEAGLLPEDTRVEWIATSDACPECEDLDGETRDLDGEYPNDGGNGPPLHPNCRCTEGIAT